MLGIYMARLGASRAHCTRSRYVIGGSVLVTRRDPRQLLLTTGAVDGISVCVETEMKGVSQSLLDWTA